MHYAISDLWQSSDPNAEKKKREVRIGILFVYWRIVLRLNRTETAHIELRERLDKLMTVTERVPNRDQVEETVDLARQILKREWEVTKFGMLRNLILWLKSQCKPFADWFTRRR
jgi:hypothetical protein